jgi:hypothetical protein
LLAATWLLTTGGVALGTPAAHAMPGVEMSGIPSDVTQVVIEAESGITGHGVPKHIYFYQVAQAQVNGASAMTVHVPGSTLLSSIAAAQHGTVNLVAVAKSPTRTYSQFFSSKLGTNGIAAAAIPDMSRAASVPNATLTARTAIPASKAGAAPAAIPGCASPCVCIGTELHSTEGTTRIGELHVADNSNMNGQFQYGSTSDNEVSVGASETGGTGSFSFDGLYTISTSIGAGGGFTHYGGYYQYVDTKTYYGYYQESGNTCSYPYIMQQTGVTDSVFPGVNTAPTNPYGSCSADPNGSAPEAPHGYYYVKNASADLYSAAMHWYGFAFEAKAGFTSNVYEQWNNNTASTYAWVCGDKNPVYTSGKLWNGLS